MSYLERFELKNKRAYVTGAAGLLGTEISRALADAGAHVIMLDIEDGKGKYLEAELNEKGARVNYEFMDVSVVEDLELNAKKLFEQYRSPDVWVNCAYPQTKDWWNKKVEELSLESWRKNVDMNLNSVAWLNRIVALEMTKQRRGSIINIGSIYGVVGNDLSIYENTDMMGSMPYSAIKGGIANLTRFMASYFGPYNIRVNCVSPGGIVNQYPDVFVKNYSSQTPLGRMGNPEEIAATVLFMASEASSYITGANIMVDGGWTAI